MSKVKIINKRSKLNNYKIGLGFAWTILSINGKGILRENREVSLYS